MCNITVDKDVDDIILLAPTHVHEATEMSCTFLLCVGVQNFQIVFVILCTDFLRLGWQHCTLCFGESIALAV